VDFRTRLVAGEATHAEIAAAETAGTLSPGRAARLRAELAADQARREQAGVRAGRIAALLEAGDRPDPDNPEDRADGAPHYETVLKPRLAELYPAQKAAAIGACAKDTGFPGQDLFRPCRLSGRFAAGQPFIGLFDNCPRCRGFFDGKII
jgi:hypothetical protein